MIGAVREIAARYDLPIPVFGHAGDGNLHPNVLVDLRDEDETRRTLMAGFTTCRDVGSSDFIDVGLRNAVASGKIVGPRMLVATKSIGATGGHCDSGSGMRGPMLSISGRLPDPCDRSPAPSLSARTPAAA